MEKYWAHSSSLIGEEAIVGEETRIWQFCNVMNGARIGKHCNVGQGVFVEDGVIIGDNVKIKNNVALYKGLECEDDVFLGPNCVFTNVINPRSFIERKDEFKATKIRRGASIGANATIVCGNEIGEYALVGAGAVVTKNVPNYALVVGNPSKIVGYVCKCGCKLHFRNSKAECEECHLIYEQSEMGVKCISD